jgi:phenylpropionate dioxygenase-like ring-hydroxylating dioxygenase large terminal subunit
MPHQDEDFMATHHRLNNDLAAKLKLCQRPLDEAWSLPPQVYTDPAILTYETNAIFRRHWLCVGRGDQLASAGDYTCLDFAGQAVILLRDKDGALRAFANTCRHRGARLMEGSGKTAGIRCPFHSWAYKLDGTLAGAPKMDEVSGFCKSDFGLISYHVAERLGFIFVCLAKDAPDLDAALGDFAAIHAPWPLESLVSKRRQQFEVNCNWKTFIEVFNEYYHLPYVHADSIDDVYHAPDEGDEADGDFATQFGSTEGTGGLLQTSQQKPLPLMPGLKGREAKGVRYTWLFPNMTFAAGVDAIWIYEAYPLAADRCLVYQTACFPPETVQHNNFEERVEAYYHRLDAALAEDIPALVNQQQGLRHPDAVQGRFQPHLEVNVARFAHWYADQMLTD